jgi:Big-like domain-containing protein
MLTIGKRSCAVALLSLTGLVCIPSHVHAQLGDTTPPTVRITSPASGAIVSGTITIAADSSDNVAVAGVQFKYNGINIGGEDNFAPYAVTADTTAVPDGTYTLTAVARDLMGNQATSAPVTVTVSNGSSADTTPVAIASPASGATVSGTITVTASASDNGGIAGVQFRVDGANRGSEDAAAPYSISWDTTTVANGSHTLTAIARDAAGNTATSSPVTVTVSNAPAATPPVKRYEETDASVTLDSGWVESSPDRDWMAWSGGTAAYGVVPGAQATFTFTGTSVTWIGYRSVDSGIARLSVDGTVVSDIDLFARRNEGSVRVFTVKGLADGSHTLTIQMTGLKNPESQGNIVVVDAFDVPAPVVSHLQDTDPDIAYTAGWTGGDISKPWSGGLATRSSTAGAQATLTFHGTAINWIGYRGPESGIANVYLDGALAGEVDTYAPSPRVQDTLFRIPGLANGSHTLTIEATGLKNGASTGATVVVDAFDVTMPGTRYQETDPALAYNGSWTHGNLNRSWSEGTVATSDVSGSQVTFTFTGTAVSWIGCRKSTTGIARVFLDGAFVAEIDTYEAPPIEGYQTTILSLTGLAAGNHTLTIEATGRKNPAADSAYVVVDAFDVIP